MTVTAYPLCVGHRGASATYPENSLLSFEKAIEDGSEGIETDIHVSLDNTLLMLHDAYLDRVIQGGSGLIKRQNYINGLDQLVTKKLPRQPIATFKQTIDLLTRPGCTTILNLDCKVDNIPDKLFHLMLDVLRHVPDYENTICPRIYLGLWHPKFIEPAKRLLPHCPRYHIGLSIDLTRRYFWDECEGFSLNFAVLVSQEGEAFRKDCKAAGKKLWIWTVNGKAEMIQGIKWGVDAILTDKTADYLALRAAMENGEESLDVAQPQLSYLSLMYYTLLAKGADAWSSFILAKRAGPLQVATSKTLTL